MNHEGVCMCGTSSLSGLCPTCEEAFKHTALGQFAQLRDAWTGFVWELALPFRWLVDRYAPPLERWLRGWRWFR